MAPVYFWPLMVAGYSTLLYVLVRRSESPKQSCLYTFIFFLGYFLTGFYWISGSLFIDFETWWWALPFSFVGIPLLLSLFPAITVGIASLTPRFKILAFMAALIIADILRAFVLTGFPWNMPIHGFVQLDLVMALLPILGFYGLNTLVILLLCIPAVILLKYSKNFYKIILLGCLLIFCFTISFAETLKPSLNHVPSNIIMVQANIPQDEKWDRDFIERNLNRYIAMSEAEIKEQNTPITIIWPETAISQAMLSYPHLQKTFYDFLARLPNGSHLITGYLYVTRDGHFNALAVLNTDGDVLDVYNKHHLVPFGEYMPLGLDTLTGVSNFQSGEPPRDVDVDGGPFQFLPMICYEVIFSRYAKTARENGIIINITNDAWFGDTAGPYQHFDHAIFRARENNTIVLRLSGNGLSGIITPDGSVPLRTQLNEQAVITAH